MTSDQMKYKIFRMMCRDIVSFGLGTGNDNGYYTCDGLLVRNTVYYVVNKMNTISESDFNIFLHDYSATRAEIYRLVEQGTISRTHADATQYETKNCVNLLNVVKNGSIRSLLNATFSHLGVSFSIGTDTSSSTSYETIILSFSDSTSITLYGLLLKYCFLIISLGQTSFYTKETMPYFNLENETGNFSDLHQYQGKGNTYYETDHISKVYIKGSGEACNLMGMYESEYVRYLYNDFAIPTQLIIGEDIDDFGSSLFARTAAELINLSAGNTKFTVYVVKCLENAYISNVSALLPAPKSAASPKKEFTIYTDNKMVKNNTWSSNIIVHIYPLSDWEGDS